MSYRGLDFDGDELQIFEDFRGSVARIYQDIDLKIFGPANTNDFSNEYSSFTNIRGLCSNFVECESFLESNFSDILALCETNLDDSIDSDNFSVRGYLPLI